MKKTVKKTSAKKLVKPAMKTEVNEFWDYHEVTSYIEKKYKVDLDNFAGCKFSGKADDKPYQNFVHWVGDLQSVHNGSYFYLGVTEVIESNDEEYAPEWVRKIMQMIFDEFGQEEMRFWVSW